MNIFFDMDYTILEIDNGTLRPFVRDVFERLSADGHTLYIWSGVGARTDEVVALGLHDLIGGVFPKPWENYTRTVDEMLIRGEIPVRPDIVVDDTAAIVRELGGIVVRPYGSMSAPGDEEMERVYRAICELAGIAEERAPRGQTDQMAISIEG
jgi:hypothetical protein